MVSKYIPGDLQLASVGIGDTEAEKFLGDESNVKNKLGLVTIKNLVEILRNISASELDTIIGETSSTSLPYYKRIIKDIIILNRELLTMISSGRNDIGAYVPLRHVYSNGRMVYALTVLEELKLVKEKCLAVYYCPVIKYYGTGNVLYPYIVSLEPKDKDSPTCLALTKATVDRLKRLGITEVSVLQTL